jgi:hypothetical protein
MAAGLKKYQALTNLSVPIKVPGEDKRTALVMKGDTVILDEETATNLQRNHRVPVIRPATEGSQPMPLLTGRSLTGMIQGPPVDARRDPKGSSQLVELKVPELTEPSIGDEQAQDTDALDLPPSGAGRVAAQRLATSGVRGAE